MRIVTRGSALALWQANYVRDALVGAGIADPITVVVRTTGDRVQDVPLARIGDRGLFTREVDDALLDGRADLAVHSLKDVPTVLPDGLGIVAILERSDPSDVLVARAGELGRLHSLPPGARVGTSSLRRRAQLAALRPDLDIVDLRGNVDTRIARVHEGVVDAAILARAGLLRLGRAKEASDVLSAPEWLPAVGQGALALVMRSDDPAGARVAALEHPPTRAAVTAERSFLRRLEGGCQVPIGALAVWRSGAIELQGAVFSLQGDIRIAAGAIGTDADPEGLGERLAERLLDDGADRVLEAVRAAAGAPEVPAP
ncbi:MAG TPA: hydroxymethylbilane synthase [Longimicrobiales bacterium]|nr:hydroxymethylbilane synthase [Longimicrobiales bacterium]